MIANLETIRTEIIAGDTTIGVAHQLYEITTADGRTRVAGQITASRLHVYPHGYGAEHTTFSEDEREAAIAWWQAGAPEPRPGSDTWPTVLFNDGRFLITLTSGEQTEREQLAEDLARWAGEAAERAHDEDVASLPEGRHYTYCCMHVREGGERNMYAFALDLPLEQLRARHAAELADRAVERARREGLL